MMNRSFDGPKDQIRILCFLALFSALAIADESPQKVQMPILDSFLKIEESFDNSADRTSQKVLTAPALTKSGSDGESVEPRPRRLYPIEIPSSANHKKEIEAIRERLLSKTKEYLIWYKNTYPTSPGIELVEPKHLSLGLLKYRRRPGSHTGKKVFTVIFDDNFHRHVRTRGLQLKLIDSQRFPRMAYILVAVFAALLVLYGILKLVNRRAKQDDFLTTSEISMV